MTISTVVKSIQQTMREDVGVDGDAQRISQMCWMLFLKIIDAQDMELEAIRKDYRSPIPRNLRWSAMGGKRRRYHRRGVIAFCQ